jgi:hypothetical protein
MTIKVEKKVKESIELELPAYYSYGYSMFKIVSENVAIQVKESEYSSCISFESAMSMTIPLVVSEGIKITEEEFTNAFERVGEKVKRELIKAIESDKWLEQEKEETDDEEKHSFRMMGVYDKSKGH